MGLLLGRTWATGREEKEKERAGVCARIGGLYGDEGSQAHTVLGLLQEQNSGVRGSLTRRPRAALRPVGGTCVPFRASGFGVLLSLVILVFFCLLKKEKV